jgi:glutamyl-tRNA reductase
VVPTIRALREKFAQVADAEVQKALDQLARKDLTRDQQRELLHRSVQLVVNKLLHQPTTVLRGADPTDAETLAAAVCELFGLSPNDTAEGVAEPSVTEEASTTGEQKKAQA